MCFSMHECLDVPAKLCDLPYSTSQLVEGILLTAISPKPKSLVLSHFRWDRAMDMATILCPRSSHHYCFSCFAYARGYNPGVFNTSFHLQILMEQPKSLKFPRSTSVGILFVLSILCLIINYVVHLWAITAVLQNFIVFEPWVTGVNSTWCDKDHCNEDDHETKMIKGRSSPLVKL